MMGTEDREMTKNALVAYGHDSIESNANANVNSHHNDTKVEEDMMQDGLMAEEIAITHGRVRALAGGRKVQAHVAPVTEVGDILRVLSLLQGREEWSEASCWPVAFRVMNGTTKSDGLEEDSAIGLIDGEEEVQHHSNNNNHQTPVIEEDSMDGNCVGAGDKLLHLLKRWEIFNAVVVVTIWESGCSTVTKGPAGARFRVIVDCAKETLEKCFLKHVEVKTRTKMNGSSILEYLQQHQQDGSVGSAFLNDLASFSLISSQSKLNIGDKKPVDTVSKRKTVPLKSMQLGTESTTELPLDQVLKAGLVPASRPVPSGHFLYGRDPAETTPRKSPRNRLVSRKNADVVRISTKPPNFSSDDIRQLRSIRKPHPMLLETMRLVALLIGVPEPREWIDIRPMFRASSLKTKMKQVSVKPSLAVHINAWVACNCPDVSARGDIFKAHPLAGRALDWILSVMQCYKGVVTQTSHQEGDEYDRESPRPISITRRKIELK